MQAKANVNGHPLHPALIAAPIGLLVAALLFDILAAAAGTPWLPAAAVATMAGTGLLALAAVPGLVDYLTVVPKEGTVRTMANRHLTLGLLLAALYVVSSILHGVAWSRQTPGALADWGLWLNIAGAIGLGAQGWIGGEMVFKGKVAVHEGGEVGAARREARKERREERRAPTRV